MSTRKQPAAQRPAKAGQPVPPAEPAYVEPPSSIILAVRLMYAGAAITAIGVVADAIQIGVSRFAVPAGRHVTAHQVHATKTALIASVVFSGLLEIGLWIFMARANRAGLSWARIAASVLTGLSTALLVTTMTGSFAGTQKAFMALTWLVALGVTFCLWRKESSGYFRTPTAPSPSSASGPGSGASGPATGRSGAARP